jgi:Ribonuclease G/E
MTDNLDQDVSRGKQALALLENPVITECFDTLRSDYLKAWEATSARDTDARERLWQAVQIVGKVRTHLNSVVSNGKLAQREIDDAAGKKPKRFGIV